MGYARHRVDMDLSVDGKHCVLSAYRVWFKVDTEFQPGHSGPFRANPRLLTEEQEGGICSSSEKEERGKGMELLQSSYH